MNSFFTRCLSLIRTTGLVLLVTGFLRETHATTFVVTSTADNTSAGTLRSAITAANADASGPHVINFNISGSGVRTITLTGGLPAITRSVTINGYSQPGASAGTFESRTILIQILVPASVANGIPVNASNVVFSGLNIVTGNNASGIYHAPAGPAANNVWIWGCNFGTNADGTAPYSDPGTFSQSGYSIAAYGNTTGPGAASTLNGWIIGTNGDGNNDNGEGNIFSPPAVTTATHDMIRVFSADNFVIAGNYFGLSRDGLTPLRAFDAGYVQHYGIAMSNCIGFTIGTNGDGTGDLSERNVFAGITGQVIAILGNPPTGNYNGDTRWPNRPDGNNRIAGNYFGTDKNGTGTGAGLRNRTAIALRGATKTTVGSLTNADMRNVIVNSVVAGIIVTGDRYGDIASTAKENRLEGNYIGVLADGLTASPNATGIFVNYTNGIPAGELSAYKNTITKNIIAHSTSRGITSNPYSSTLAYDNTFSQNSIYGNANLGINLGAGATPADYGVTPNDGLLSTPGTTNANRFMDYGVIKKASLNGNSLTIDGFIGTNPAGTTNFGAGAVVEFYIADNSPDDQKGERFAGDGLSLPHGEGKTYLGTLVADANGLFSGTIDVTGKGFVAGTSYITNTATEMAATGSTSEFGVNVTPLAVSGTVFNDSNGNTDGSVNGTGTNAGGTLFVALYDNTTGQVIDVASVNPDGTYSFTGAVSGSDYSVYLTTTEPVVGQSSIPAITMPAGWVNTGEVNCPTAGCAGNDGTADGVLPLGVLAADATATGFGINRVPDTDAVSHVMTSQPTSGDELVLDGSGGPVMTGSDPEDGTYSGSTGSVNNPQGVVITSLPTNGELWYQQNGAPVQVTAADITNGTLFSDPSQFSIVLTGSNYTSTTFEYAFVDAAGVVSPTPATYTISWENPLPVTLVAFDVYTEGRTAVLKWATSTEINSKAFEIERSADAVVWTKIGTVASQNRNSNTVLHYHFADGAPLKGTGYYRLKMVDMDHTFAYSRIRSYRTDYPVQRLVTYPNPVTGGTLRIDLTGDDAYQAEVTSVSGIRLLQQDLGKSRELNVSNLTSGVYVLRIKSGNGEIHRTLFVVK